MRHAPGRDESICVVQARPPAGATGAAGRVFGWAGWTHLEQLQGVIALWEAEWDEHGAKVLPLAARDGADEARRAENAAVRGRLVPLLQTMVDLLPWVRQWHDEEGAADQFEKYVAEECRKVELSGEEVRGWRAAKVERRGRAKPAARVAKDVVTPEAVLAAVKAALEDGSAEIGVSALAAKMSATAARLKEPLESLLAEGRLREQRKSPRTVALP